MARGIFDRYRRGKLCSRPLVTVTDTGVRSLRVSSTERFIEDPVNPYSSVSLSLSLARTRAYHRRVSCNVSRPPRGNFRTTTIPRLSMHQPHFDNARKERCPRGGKTTSVARISLRERPSGSRRARNVFSRTTRKRSRPLSASMCRATRGPGDLYLNSVAASRCIPTTLYQHAEEHARARARAEPAKPMAVVPMEGRCRGEGGGGTLPRDTSGLMI